jgi:hypothetical protein
MEEKMRGKIISLAISLVVLLGLTGNVTAAEYDHETEVRGMNFAWKVADGNLHIKLMGRTTGWVGIGFNPSKGMQDANFILGYVDKGKVEISDDFGDTPINHQSDEEMGGTTNVTVVGGEEKGRATTLEFFIPLDSGDKYDSVLDPQGKTKVLLAFGGNRDSFRSKHRSNAVITVNLSTGEVE